MAIFACPGPHSRRMTEADGRGKCNEAVRNTALLLRLALGLCGVAAFARCFGSMTLPQRLRWVGRSASRCSFPRQRVPKMRCLILDFKVRCARLVDGTGARHMAGSPAAVWLVPAMPLPSPACRRCGGRAPARPACAWSWARSALRSTLEWARSERLRVRLRVLTTRRVWALEPRSCGFEDTLGPRCTCGDTAPMWRLPWCVLAREQESLC